MSYKKRLAYCIYGQVRFVDKLREYFDFIFDNEEYDVDIFIATWNDFDTDLLNINFKDKLFLDERELIRNWDDDTGNTPRMSYLLSKVVELKRKTEIYENFEYDYVVLARPDVVIGKQRFFECLDLLNFNNYNTPCVFTLTKIRLQDKFLRLDGDYLFIENSIAADLHSLIYNIFYINRLYLKHNTHYREGGHWIHPYLFNYFNFLTFSFHLDSFLVRPTLDNHIFVENYNNVNLISKLVENKIKYSDKGVVNKNFKEKIV